MKNKVNEKNIIILFIIILLIITLIIFLNKKEKNNINDEILLSTKDEQIPSNIIMKDEEFAVVESNLKMNTSEKLKEEKTFNDLTVKDAQIVAGGRYASFDAVVKNNLEKDIEGTIVYIVFVDKEGNEISKVETMFPDTFAGQESMITATTAEDISNAYNYYIVKK